MNVFFFQTFFSLVTYQRVLCKKYHAQKSAQKVKSFAESEPFLTGRVTIQIAINLR